jgi:DNA processing protein
MSTPPDVPPREWFALARAPRLHAGHLNTASETCAAVDLPGRPEKELLALGLQPAAAHWLAAPDWLEVDADRAWAISERIQLVTLGSTAYPPLLAVTDGAPVALWVRGDPRVLNEPQVAIVGSRRPTAGGRRNAADWAAQLVGAGLTITSGMALGIDAAAHEGALAARGRSIAVCGTGLDICYPAQHAGLAARLAAAGAVISEFPPRVLPRRQHFPRRNRIISGLSLGVLVVEAARDSGSLITARLAGEQGRHVLAVPGSIHSPVSRGCHELIRQGAQLVESAAEVLTELGWRLQMSDEKQRLTNPKGIPVGARRLDKGGEMLLDALGFEPASIDDLIDRTGQQAQDIAVRLMLLELEGLVETLPGGQYSRVPHPANRKVN